MVTANGTRLEHTAEREHPREDRFKPVPIDEKAPRLETMAKAFPDIYEIMSIGPVVDEFLQDDYRRRHPKAIYL